MEDTPFSRKTRRGMNEEDCFAAGQQARGISQLTTPAQIGEVGERSCSAVGGVELYNKLISFLARTRRGMKGFPDEESEEEERDHRTGPCSRGEALQYNRILPRTRSGNDVTISNYGEQCRVGCRLDAAIHLRVCTILRLMGESNGSNPDAPRRTWTGGKTGT